MGAGSWIAVAAALTCMTTLIVTLNYLSHKEYASEVAMLRKALLVRDDLAGAAARLGLELASLRKEADSKEALCRTLNETLAVQSERLLETTRTLQATRATLVGVMRRRKKSRTVDVRGKEDREQSDMAEGGGHGGLTRRRSVDVDRHRASKDFQMSFDQNMARMEKDIQTFADSQVEFCRGLQTNLGERLDRKVSEVAALGDQMTHLVDTLAEGLQNLGETFSKHAQYGHSAVMQFLAHSRQTQDSEADCLHRFLADGFLPGVQTLVRALDMQKTELGAAQRMLAEQVQYNSDLAQGFATSFKDALRAVKGASQQQWNHAQKMAEVVRSSSGAMRREQERLGTELSSRLQGVQTMLAAALDVQTAHHTSATANLQELDRRVDAELRACDEAAQNVGKHVASELSRATEEEGALQQRAKDLLGSLDTYAKGATSGLDGVRETLDTLEDNVRQAVAAGEAAWRRQASWNEGEMRKLGESLGATLQLLLTGTQSFGASLRDAARSHEAVLEEQRADFSGFVRARQEELESRCSEVMTWGHLTGAELRRWGQEVGKHISGTDWDRRRWQQDAPEQPPEPSWDQSPRDSPLMKARNNSSHSDQLARFNKFVKKNTARIPKRAKEDRKSIRQFSR